MEFWFDGVGVGIGTGMEFWSDGDGVSIGTGMGFWFDGDGDGSVFFETWLVSVVIVLLFVSKVLYFPFWYL